MSHKILVTGATGNVGRWVVQQLIELGIQPRIAVRVAHKVETLQASVEPVEMDLNKPETVQAAFEGIEKVFLVSPFVPNMVEMTAVQVDAAKKAGLKHIVRLSAIGADLAGSMTLGKWHGEAENLIKKSGIPYTYNNSSEWLYAKLCQLYGNFN